jgi:hypothetical protein
MLLRDNTLLLFYTVLFTSIYTIRAPPTQISEIRRERHVCRANCKQSLINQAVIISS